MTSAKIPLLTDSHLPTELFDYEQPRSQGFSLEGEGKALGTRLDYELIGITVLK